MTFVDRRRFVLGIAPVLAALGAPGFAHAQAESNPSLNAQLLVAARQGNLAQVERSLDAGAAPGSRNRLGKTALLLAAEKGNLPIVEAMLKRGADVNQASLEGVTPLMAAAYVGAAPVVKQLLTACAHRPARPHEQTGDRYAAGQGRAGAVDALLRRESINATTAPAHCVMWAAGATSTR
jgi:ankyrin repeat protein